MLGLYLLNQALPASQHTSVVHPPHCRTVKVAVPNFLASKMLKCIQILFAADAAVDGPGVMQTYAC